MRLHPSLSRLQTVSAGAGEFHEWLSETGPEVQPQTIQISRCYCNYFSGSVQIREGGDT